MYRTTTYAVTTITDGGDYRIDCSDCYSDNYNDFYGDGDFSMHYVRVKYAYQGAVKWMSSGCQVGVN